MNTMKNASTYPRRYFGLHMAEGVAEYNDGKEPYRIFINEETIKRMDPTFEGRPVYVKHVAEVDLKNIQAEADGYVVKSFFNKSDGKHWVEFLIVSDRGHDALSKGWKLSNAYLPKLRANPGLWHGVQYSQEVVGGEYEHLAIVANPRYDESIILTPEEFKKYNSDKELALLRIANSKENKMPAFNFFKKQKVENANELESTLVTLPKAKVDMTISQIIEEFDTIKNMNGYACPEHMVKVNDDEEMSVMDLSNKYNGLMKKMKKNEEAAAKEKEEMEAKAKKENEGELSEEDKAAKEAEAAAVKAAEEKAAAEAAAAKEADPVKKGNLLNELANAHLKMPFQATVDVGQLERGKQRYGSGK